MDYAELVEIDDQAGTVVMVVPPEMAFSMYLLCTQFNALRKANAKLTGEKCGMLYAYKVDPYLKVQTATNETRHALPTVEWCGADV